MKKKSLILYPHQLYPIEALPSDITKVYMVEEPLLFGTDPKWPVRMHVQKLILHRASMRRYVEEVLWPADIDVEYIEPGKDWWSGQALATAASDGFVYLFDPTDDVLYRRLLKAEGELPSKIQVAWLESPNFYLKSSEVHDYFGKKKKHSFANFYQWQRERFGILLTKGFKPVGGQWSFDKDNRKKLPKNKNVPSPTFYGDNDYVTEAKAYVAKKFDHYHGSADSFIWPTNGAESLQWLDQFIDERLEHFGPYEDSVEPQHTWVFHSVITPMLNIGLINPQQVIARVLDRHAYKPVSLASLEGFVRQVVGWREYMRGLYLTHHTDIRGSNQLRHTRRLHSSWYDGTTGLPPVDDVINKMSTHAYAHHIERLMIIGNAMCLSEIHPDDVYRWFMEMSIDGYDWVMVPNVYAMSQYANSSVTTKPYVSGSNYLLKMSHYAKDDWHVVWDALFWRFVGKHKAMLKRNPRTSMMVTQYDRMGEDRKRVLAYRADDFLDTHTS